MYAETPPGRPRLCNAAAGCACMPLLHARRAAHFIKQRQRSTLSSSLNQAPGSFILWTAAKEPAPLYASPSWGAGPPAGLSPRSATRRRPPGATRSRTSPGAGPGAAPGAARAGGSASRSARVT